MKKTILILLIALGVKAQQQVNLQIVRCTPTVCAGDSVRINYKGIWPANTANQYTFYLRRYKVFIFSYTNSRKTNL